MIAMSKTGKILTLPETERISRERDSDCGIACPSCGCGHCPVDYTRHRKTGKTIRRRTCRHCQRRFVTTERVS